MSCVSGVLASMVPGYFVRLVVTLCAWFWGRFVRVREAVLHVMRVNVQVAYGWVVIHPVSCIRFPGLGGFPPVLEPPGGVAFAHARVTGLVGP